MKKEDEKIDFDLSALDLHQLIDVYQDITDFLHYLEENKIVEKEAEDE